MLTRHMSRVPILVVFLVATAGYALSQDNWLGGTGNWSTGALWSTGVPLPGNDVSIYSGGSDYVTLDVNATIKSLMLGGAYNGFTSELTDNGSPWNLTIAGALNLGQTGDLNLSGGSTVSAGANSTVGGIIFVSSASTLSFAGNVDNPGSIVIPSYGGVAAVNISGTLTNDINSGFIIGSVGGTSNIGALVNNGDFLVGSGAAVNLTNQPAGITDVSMGAEFDIFGSFTSSGKDAFANLTSVEGTLQLADGQNHTIDPSGGKLAIAPSGVLYVLDTTNLTIDGTIQNNGSVYVGATLTLTNQQTIADVPAGAMYQIFGTFNAGSNNAFSGLTTIEGSVILALQPTTNITPSGGMLTIASTGLVDSSDGTRLIVNGNLNNIGILSTNAYAFSLELPTSAITVLGTLTNNGHIYGNGGSISADNIVNNNSIQQFNLGNGVNISAATLTNNGTIQQFDNSSGQVNTILATSNMVNSGFIYQYGYSGQNVIKTPQLDNAGTIIQYNTSFADSILVGTGVAAAPGYYQLANGTLGEYINMSSFGVVNIMNGAPVTLNGTLDILLQSGFNPGVGSTYDFINLTPGQLNGVFVIIQNILFNNGTEKWVVIYDNTGGHVELQARATPEPSSFLLLGTGLLSVAYGVRLRWSH